MSSEKNNPENNLDANLPCTLCGGTITHVDHCPNQLPRGDEEPQLQGRDYKAEYENLVQEVLRIDAMAHTLSQVQAIEKLAKSLQK